MGPVQAAAAPAHHGPGHRREPRPGRGKGRRRPAARAAAPAARAAMWAGTRRLILLGAPSPIKSIAGRLSTPAKLALSHNPHGSVAAMFADCVNCAADYLMAEAGGPAWDREGFARLSAAVR